MSTNHLTARVGAEPTWTLPWTVETSQNVFSNYDTSSGFTFTMTLTNEAGTDVVTKTTGITGADGSVAIAIAVDELEIAAALYTLHLRARETATSKDSDYSPESPVTVNIIP